MGLNRTEQILSDYVQAHTEERHYWQEKVRTIATKHLNDHDVAHRLDTELWTYFCERSAVVQPFKAIAAREGLTRVSMRGLAEYWMRVWIIPRTPAKGSTKSRKPGRP